MESKFMELRNSQDFRVEVVMYLRSLLRINYINYSEIKLDPHPYKLIKENEIALKFGDLSFICEVVADGYYAFR